MADPKKLRALLDSQVTPTSGGADYGGAVIELRNRAAESERPEDVVLDETSEEAVIARKIGVGYMEIVADAGGFSCGACRYAAPGPSDEESVCVHIQVRAPVSGTHGCCNLFWPDAGGVTFPTDALDPSDDDAGGGDRRDPPEEDEGGEGGGEGDEGGGEEHDPY